MAYRPDQSFKIPRTVLARLAAEQYVRSFWWFVVSPPLFGLVALFSGNALIEGIGMFGILWPVSIPARAYFISAKASSLFSNPVRLLKEADSLYFIGENGKGSRLSLKSVRKVSERYGYMILSFGIGEFVAIPTGYAPPLEEMEEWRREARTHVRQESGDPS